MNVGLLISTKRKEKGMTQKELAEKVGVSEATISRWESGEIKNMKRKFVGALANALGISPLLFMDWPAGKETDCISSSPDFFEEKTKETAAEDLPPLTPRDERQIARDLEKMLADLDDKNDLAAVGGTVEDAEDRELLRASLLTSMRLAKQIAKKKFTPKKYRKDDIE